MCTSKALSSLMFNVLRLRENTQENDSRIKNVHRGDESDTTLMGDTEVGRIEPEHASPTQAEEIDAPSPGCWLSWSRKRKRRVTLIAIFAFEVAIRGSHNPVSIVFVPVPLIQR